MTPPPDPSIALTGHIERAVDTAFELVLGDADQADQERVADLSNLVAQVLRGIGAQGGDRTTYARRPDQTPTLDVRR